MYAQGLSTEQKITKLVDLIKQGEEVVVLVGSAISMWAPTNLPSGTDITESVSRVLFPDKIKLSTSEDTKYFDKLFGKIPFEVINDRCPKINNLNKILIHILGVTPIPNPIHYMMAKLLVEGKIQSIITTNYDCALDKAIADLCNVQIGDTMGNIKRIFKNNIDAQDIIPHQSYLFKIHGSVDDGDGSSLVFSLNQEGILPNGKKLLFQNLIKDRLLLIIGYSGKDFEICPEIPSAQPDYIFWNFKTEKMVTPNAKWVENTVNQISGEQKANLVYEDMWKLLSTIFFPIVKTDKIPFTDLSMILKSGFSDFDRLLWRMKILNSVNYNSAVLVETYKLLNQHNLDFLTQINILNEHAEALQSSGSYKQAAKTREKIAQVIKQQNLSIEEYYINLLSSSDMWRCYGDLIHSIQTHLMIKREIKDFSEVSDDVQMHVYRNELLLLRELYRFLKFFHLKYLYLSIRNKASNIITAGSNIALKNGDRYALQQFHLWSGRFNLPDESHFAESGYEHLNFRMGQMMTFRDKVQSGKISLTQDVLNEAEEYIKEAEILGIKPEVWKISLLIFLKSKGGRTQANLKRFWNNFFSCEYTLFLRVSQLIAG